MVAFVGFEVEQLEGEEFTHFDEDRGCSTGRERAEAAVKAMTWSCDRDDASLRVARASRGQLRIVRGEGGGSQTRSFPKHALRSLPKAGKPECDVSSTQNREIHHEFTLSSRAFPVR